MKKLILIIALCLCVTITSIPVMAESNSDIVFLKGSECEKKIALTFDDGPHPRYTDKILDILAKYNIKATFFVIGVNIENYPDPLKRIKEEGHEIGNHSYDHSNEKNIDSACAEAEISKCEELIYNSVGVIPSLFRPPQGQYSKEVEQVAQSKNYSIILWSIDTRDWEHNSASSIMNTVNKNIKGGDIILMHDYVSGKNTTCEALELIIPSLLEQGYEFVTVSELIHSK